jgi:iron complex transport system permease protein
MRHKLVPLGLVALCFLVFVAAVSVGPSGLCLPFPMTDIVAEIRAPRVVLSGVLGASLAVVGVAMQALLRNDLADPYVLGLSGGASAGAVASLALFPWLSPGPLAAAGAASAGALVRGLSRGPHDPTRLLLAGTAVGSFLASATGLILVLAPAERLLRTSTYWLFGGLGTPHWLSVFVPACLFALALAWMLVRAERIDRLTLGDDVAVALGVEVTALRRGIFLVCVALTASAVAAAGLIGFVGLIAPHSARRLVGAPHRHLLPVAAAGGALLLMAADAIARTAFAPLEVPVGLITAAIGGPFFLVQLQRGRR